jgi:hypothetical protein
MTLEILWAGRDLVDTRAAVERGLRWMGDGLNAAGCLSYWDPWGFVGVLGTIDHPLAGEALRKQVGMVLRSQQPDGGWGDNSFRAFRALKLHGLLEPLRAAPPLPPDWEVVRSIPAPKGALWTLTWDGAHLWVKDGDTDTAVALDPRDGAVLRTIRLPDGRTEGLGLWDGQLAAIQSDPKRVLKLDRRTGEVLREIPIGFAAWPGCGIAQVSGMLWVTDGYLFPGWVVDPENPFPEPPPGAIDDMAWRARLEPHLAGPLPVHLAPTPEGVWQTDFWSQLLLESGPGGALVDWAEKPFGPATAGIAWDGENLWALDGAQGRICIVRRRLR